MSLHAIGSIMAMITYLDNLHNTLDILCLKEYVAKKNDVRIVGLA